MVFLREHFWVSSWPYTVLGGMKIRVCGGKQKSARVSGKVRSDVGSLPSCLPSVCISQKLNTMCGAVAGAGFSWDGITWDSPVLGSHRGGVAAAVSFAPRKLSASPQPACVAGRAQTATFVMFPLHCISNA